MLALASMSAYAAAVASAPTIAPSVDPVKNCPPGLVCFTPAEVGEIDKKMIQLQRDLTVASAKNRRFGLGVT